MHGTRRDKLNKANKYCHCNRSTIKKLAIHSFANKNNKYYNLLYYKEHV